MRAARVLPRPGVVLEQHVAAGQDRRQDTRERLALADDGGVDLVEDAAADPRHLG